MAAKGSRITIRLDEAEHERLAELAAENGRTLADYARHVLMRGTFAGLIPRGEAAAAVVPPAVAASTGTSLDVGGAHVVGADEQVARPLRRRAQRPAGATEAPPATRTSRKGKRGAAAVLCRGHNGQPPVPHCRICGTGRYAT